MIRSPEPVFVETKEYLRFLEFCDACRRYRYIGVCYGFPGVGKTISARHYTERDKDYAFMVTSYKKLARRFIRSDTIFYTPPILDSPTAINNGIHAQRDFFRDMLIQRLRAEEDVRIEAVRQRAERLKEKSRNKPFRNSEFLKIGRAERAVVKANGDASERCQAVPKMPPALVVIDEADRLKVAGLEQVRDIFDRWGVGVVFIGMPGIEKRLARYPQLYSRVGFVHEFRPLAETETRHLLRERRWCPPDVYLPASALDDDEAFAAVLRITGGNFRLLHRLLTQVGRVMEINQLDRVTVPVVDAARESLVIGTA